MQKLVLFSSILVLLFSCKTQEDNFNLEEGKEYFPLAIGKTTIYEMDSTIYDPNGMEMVRQSITQLREEIVDTLTDLEGNLLYKIEQSTRLGDSLPWQIQNVYTAGIIDNQGQRTEENLKLINIVFPIRDNNSWEATQFISEQQIVLVAGETIEMFKGWDSRIRDVDLVDTLKGQIFEEVVNISHADENNLVELRQATERYAKDIGLIYRELRILDTQCTSVECDLLTWEEKAEKGFILRQTILDY